MYLLDFRQACAAMQRSVSRIKEDRGAGMSSMTPLGTVITVGYFATVVVVPIWLLGLLVRNIADIRSPPQAGDESQRRELKLRLLLSKRLGILAALVGAAVSLYEIAYTTPRLLPLDSISSSSVNTQSIAILVLCVCGSLRPLCVTSAILCFGVLQYCFFDHYWMRKDIRGAGSKKT